jgi:hypothetical protein
VLWAARRRNRRWWSIAGGLVVKRKSNPKEPTLMGSGLIDGMPTGMHFRLMVYDDVIELARRHAGNGEQGHERLGAVGQPRRRRGAQVAHRHALLVADTYGVILDARF